ncbi:hypothetical protein NEOLEDRAFT_273790 [Neolentinus lepideus HHB14362 ss-1]|uniref:F-box domain-containing protein n=1 Tax=Neolentinus lepideus HHB14362 ss-1 TaxID=1314782 RepID=A0A165T5C0_9AGAM|nr:hypothetical protein NEOLEDRAFT_273790 [Neolentinus lepideus HHB14362 ss-1]
MAIDFSALPYDILVSICASVTHRQTLIACSLVCRSFHDAVKPTLYRDIVFNDTDDSDGVFGVIEAQPHLRGYVRSATHITTRLERTGSLWDDKEDRKPKWPNPLSRLYNLDSYTLRPSTPLHPIEPKNFDFLLCISHVFRFRFTAAGSTHQRNTGKDRNWYSVSIEQNARYGPIVLIHPRAAYFGNGRH